MLTEQMQVLLQEGIAAARSGDREIAYPLFREVTELDPTHELGWLWLAAVARSPQESKTYLHRTLEINPSNARAQAGLKWLQDQNTHESPAHTGLTETTEKARECPFCSCQIVETAERCDNCGIFLVLTNLEAIFTNVSVHEETIRAAIMRFEQIPDHDRDYDSHYALGLAFLHLREVSQGVGHLTAASRLRPDLTVLGEQIRDLQHFHARRQVPVLKQSSRTVLIADDSPTVRKLVTLTLERHGHRILAAVDGMEALARLNDEIPDLILLDITMPRMDGYQVCKTIKASQATKNVPVVMLSGKDGLVDKMRGRMAGSTDHIAKPFNPVELLQIVEKYC